MDCVLAPMTKAISFTDNNVRFIRALSSAAQNGADYTVVLGSWELLRCIQL